MGDPMPGLSMPNCTAVSFSVSSHLLSLLLNFTQLNSGVANAAIRLYCRPSSALDEW